MIAWLILALAGVLGGLFFGGIFHQHVLGVIISAFFVYCLFGFKQVRAEQRYVVELFGDFRRILDPGLQWIWPIFESVRAVVSMWIMDIPLFEEEIKIDFLDGSAIPRGVSAQVQIYTGESESPYDAGDGRWWSAVRRAIYAVSNWRSRTKEILENAVRSRLNGLNLDEALVLNGPGMTLQDRLGEDQLNTINGALREIGIELRQITIRDFDLSPELVAARSSIQIANRELEAAKIKAQTQAQASVGSLVAMIAAATGETVAVIEEKIRKNGKLRKEIVEFSKAMVVRQTAMANNALREYRFGGDDGRIGQIVESLVSRYFKGV